MQYWYWSALAATSAVIKDNVWINRAGLYKLYPNIYVMLHGKSGIKKGPPVNMAKKLAQGAGGVNIYTGRSSIQGILKDMGTTQSAPGGSLVNKSKSFICSSELTSSIVEDKVALTILTDLYDRNYNDDQWKSLLKMEHFSLRDPTITMLTATNEAHAAEFFLGKDVHGGYFARTFIIYAEKRNRVNSLMFAPEAGPAYKDFIEYLKVIGKLQGEMEMDHEAKIYYDKWYTSFIESIDEQKIDDPTGTLNRFGDSVLKVAIVTALATTPDLCLKKDHIEEAISQCEKLIGNVRKVTLGKGGSESARAESKALIMLDLAEREPHAINRDALNKKYWRRHSSKEWDEIMQDLEAAKVIEIVHSGDGTSYRMPEEQVIKIRRHLAGKNNSEV